ncbi:relaxase MobL (plasmid) [Lactobacillus sp. ESL0731]|uniref:MobP2 family relaxase n=1 Tax=unclassified Lactobacillus TaxID=2620435 RepID=UPI0023F8F9F7|nr:MULTISPECIES: MobP2 family relaxase [unclassified Lactobacillus]WEV52111.1 relaxase MobL [Lactobacillus sp. ESL0700]WEV63256.1 relaxase MobL [Lactobacillus sp. ESL0731]
MSKTKIPHIILTSKFTYSVARSKTKTDYGNYAVDYMGRKKAIENLAYLTPEEETKLLQRKAELGTENEPLLQRVSNYSPKLKGDSILEKDNKTELDKPNFFELDGQDYGKYIGYMMRKQALASKKKSEGLSQKEEAELARVTKGAAKYDAPNIEGKNKVLQGYFSSDQNTIRLKDLGSIRQKMRSAQANNSVLWQDVISFDNNYLRKMGVFDPTTGYLDEAGIRKASAAMMSNLIKEENLNLPFWTASIHRNTDNIHIHFALVEGINSRPEKHFTDKHGVEHTAPTGWRKATTIHHMKSNFTGTMFDTSSMLKEMNLQRNKITKGMAAAFDQSLQKEPSFQKELNKFVKTLPENTAKWRWADLNSNQRKQLNNLVDLTMKDNPSYQKWNNLFSKYQTYYTEMYGQSKDNKKNTAAKKWEDLKYRAGNSLLKELRTVTEQSNHARQNYSELRKQRQQEFTKKVKQQKRKKELDFALKKTVQPTFSKNKSAKVYKQLQNTNQKNFASFEKQQALTTYEQVQHAIDLEIQQR